MARSNRFYRLAQSLRGTAVGEAGILDWVNREATAIIGQMREVLAAFVERPEIPIFDSSPVTDADFERGVASPPRDGVLSYSSVDGKLYIRNGSATHEQVN